MPDPRVGWAIATLLVVLPAVTGTGPSGGGASPLGSLGGAAFLSGLTVAPLPPGGSGPIALSITNPLGGPIVSVVLTLEVYAFEPYPGNSSQAVPPGSLPSFHGAANGNGSVSLFVSSLGSKATYAIPGNASLSIAIPAGAGEGTYAIRTALAFTTAAGPARLESRGFFSSAEWTNATLLANGTPTLNLSRLGVDGVVPETAVLVRSSPIPYLEYGLLGTAFGLAGLGGYFAWRGKGAGSSSGAWKLPDAQSAPRAFGKRRSRDGDSRNS